MSLRTLYGYRIPGGNMHTWMTNTSALILLVAVLFSDVAGICQQVTTTQPKASGVALFSWQDSVAWECSADPASPGMLLATVDLRKLSSASRLSDVVLQIQITNSKGKVSKKMLHFTDDKNPSLTGGKV